MGNALFKAIKSAPKTPGVYLFSNQKEEIIYVGKAISLQTRLKSYLDKNLGHKTKLLMSKVSSVKYFQVFSEIEALILEASLIKKYQPLYNLRLKDDKSFLYIAMTKEEFPKVLVARKKDLPKPKDLFGPFPSSQTVRSVLAFLRKIYPFCQQKTNSRPCFWSHLKLCDPCPGEIMQESNPPVGGQAKQQLKKNYLSNIRNLVSILNGKSKNLVSVLNKKMNQAVKSESFEKAAFYRNQIQRLNYITKPNHSLSSFLETPNFFEEEQKKEVEELEKVLQSFRHPELGSGSVTGRMPKQVRHDNLKRIECFDISNLQGQFAVGSMAVFVNGVSSKKDYRRFKIKISGSKGPYEDSRKPNDTAMLSEVLQRRLTHTEWPFPDLIVVDGGKGQVSICISALAQCSKKIPVIGLAKRLETIIIPVFQRHPESITRHSELGSESVSNEERMLKKFQHDKLRFQEINLPLNSPALNFLKRLRDEAHRFGITYHRQLRKKAFLFD